MLARPRTQRAAAATGSPTLCWEVSAGRVGCLQTQVLHAQHTCPHPTLSLSALFDLSSLQVTLRSQSLGAQAAKSPQTVCPTCVSYSLLSSNTVHPPPSPAWLLAAALHFTIQRTGQCSIQSELDQLPSYPGEQVRAHLSAQTDLE